MRSKVTNENTWGTKWTTKTSRRALRRTKKTEFSKRNTAMERTLRRLESNERERMRMHSLNDAFQV